MGIMLVTRVSTAMVKSTGEASSCGLTDLCTPASSSKTTSTVMVSTHGQTVDSMTANGRTTKWTVKESSLGLTEGNTKDSMSTIKRRDMECLHGPMAASTMETGGMESSMAQAFITQAVGKLRRENGPTASVFAGLMRPHLNEWLV